MRGPVRLPLFVAVTASLVLMAVLATLQYRWLGRVSDAERERMRATLDAHAAAFAQDLDRELTRAYVTFQFDPVQITDSADGRTSARFARWQATARYPRLIQDVFLVAADPAPRIERFNPKTRLLEAAAWPGSLASLRAHLAAPPQRRDNGNAIVRALPPAVMDDPPALVVPMPLFMLTPHGPGAAAMPPQTSCTVLLLDRGYLEGELLPALARQHFRGTGDGIDYQLAVVRPGPNGVVYRSDPGFSPDANARVDASVNLFQVRLQDFGELVSEVRRFSTFLATAPRPDGPAQSNGPERRALVRETFTVPPGPAQLRFQQGVPLSIVVEQAGPVSPDRLAAAGSAAAQLARPVAPRWSLMVKHPSGSLEHAVDTARRRNLFVSSGILGVLGISLGFLVVSTRRAQALARQQMEFVATVSHELRTPLAVIRSAADNLADGVVSDQEHVREYGDLVRREGRRLSDLVEQVLEYAGLEAGERPPRPRAVSITGVVRDVVDGARAAADRAAVSIELRMPAELPPVAGEEAALRRVFQNLLGNALKYGADGRWVGIDVSASSDTITVTIADRGIGISAADCARIFDPFYRAPDVVAAQIQGAGLGLSLVKRIVDAHRGRISVQSVPGQGSTFAVPLPVADSAGRETAGALGPAPAGKP